jgi:hypothetical protein
MSVQTPSASVLLAADPQVAQLVREEAERQAQTQQPITRWIDAGVQAARHEDGAALERLAGEVGELAAAFPAPGA